MSTPQVVAGRLGWHPVVGALLVAAVAVVGLPVLMCTAPATTALGAFAALGLIAGFAVSGST
ncbi:MAG: hypothetical protein CSA58_09000 [Micrococcales bacterium]|nr:MAG: hypothetical protein CSB46_08035 [Micrococcales bacterium]PIE26522.1 MAG: hypothetical protein CSA58_09000 [Micrococcales bacterium]